MLTVLLSRRRIASVLTIALSSPALKVRADGGKSTVGFAFPKGIGLRANSVTLQSVSTDFVPLARNSLQGGLMRLVQDFS